MADGRFVVVVGLKATVGVLLMLDGDNNSGCTDPAASNDVCLVI
jgi:hypothetical protein